MDPAIGRALDGFCAALRDRFADELRAVVLFGSGAEDRLRATSDLNLIVVLRAFDAGRAAAFAAAWAPEWTAARLHAMWLREDEIAEAAAAFAVKFRDIARRRRVLHGDDPFAALAVPRAAAIAQLRQALLGQVLALRRAAAIDRDLTAAIAAASGPLRSAAAELLELEGAPAGSPKAALQRIAGAPLDDLSRVRDGARLAPARAVALVGELIALLDGMRGRARTLA